MLASARRCAITWKRILHSSRVLLPVGHFAVSHTDNDGVVDAALQDADEPRAGCFHAVRQPVVETLLVLICVCHCVSFLRNRCVLKVNVTRFWRFFLQCFDGVAFVTPRTGWSRWRRAGRGGGEGEGGRRRVCSRIVPCCGHPMNMPGTSDPTAALCARCSRPLRLASPRHRRS